MNCSFNSTSTIMDIQHCSIYSQCRNIFIFISHHSPLILLFSWSHDLYKFSPLNFLRVVPMNWFIFKNLHSFNRNSAKHDSFSYFHIITGLLLNKHNCKFPHIPNSPLTSITGSSHLGQSNIDAHRQRPWLVAISNIVILLISLSL